MKFDTETIYREIGNKVPGIYELRIYCTDFFNTRLSAYFDRDEPETVIEQMIHRHYPINCNVNFYLTVNPVNEYCRSREQFNDIRRVKVITSESDIARLNWLALDLDTIHPAGTSATSDEVAKAEEQTKTLLDHMRKEGFDNPEIVFSGNGYHLKYRIDYPNDTEHRIKISGIIDSLHARFPLINQAAKNSSFIMKLPGTLAMRGKDTAERPHRMSYIIRDPGPIGTEVAYHDE